jgi:hypothetical protein
MGKQGVGSEETDEVFNAYFNFNRYFLEKRAPDILRLEKPLPTEKKVWIGSEFDDFLKSDPYTQKSEKFIKNNKNLFTTDLIEYIELNEDELDDNIILGVIIKLVQDITYDSKQTSKPLSLWKGFPEKLRKIACTIIEQLVRIGPDIEEWESDIDERKEALKSEADLFRCKINKNKSNNKCVRSNATKYTNRKSPPYPANNCKNMVMKGNDNKEYISTPDKNGVYHWHIKKQDGGYYYKYMKYKMKYLELKKL